MYFVVPCDKARTLAIARANTGRANHSQSSSFRPREACLHEWQPCLYSMNGNHIPMCGSSVEPGFTLTLPLLHPLRFPGHTLIVVPPVRLFVKMRLPLALGQAISYAIIYKDPAGHSYPNG